MWCVLRRFSISLRSHLTIRNVRNSWSGSVTVPVSNVETELVVFEKSGHVAVINKSKEPRQTKMYVYGKLKEELDLAPMEMRWVDYEK